MGERGVGGGGDVVGEVEDLERLVGEGGGEGPLEEVRGDGGVAAEDAKVGVALVEGRERGGERCGGAGGAVAAEDAGARGDGEEEEEGEADVAAEEGEGFDFGGEEGNGDGAGVEGLEGGGGGGCSLADDEGAEVVPDAKVVRVGGGGDDAAVEVEVLEGGSSVGEDALWKGGLEGGPWEERGWLTRSTEGILWVDLMRSLLRLGSREGRTDNRSQLVSRRSMDSRVDEAIWSKSRMRGRPTPDRRRWVRKVR